MKGLIKENYASLRLYIWLLMLSGLNLSPFSLSGQYCDIKVASEPIVQTVALTPGKVSQSIGSQFNQWTNLSSLVNAKWDVKSNMAKPGFTTTLRFSDFKFNLPIGSTINGIRVKTTGRSEGSGAFVEEKIQLITGDITSINRSKQGYNSNNVFVKSATSKTWYYGTNTDTWGAQWNPSDINSSDFGIEIQLTSVSSKLIAAIIENLSMEISYTPAATFCTTDCFPIYTKQENPAIHHYLWKLPPGFELISRSENHYIVDLKPLKAVNGLHVIKVDAIDANGKILQTCSRTVRIRNCTPSTIGNRVWNDLNFNGLQDANEPGIANIRVGLINVTTNKEVAFTNTNVSGLYLFSNLSEGNYKVKVTIPQEYVITKSESTDSLNSDFIANSDASKNIALDFNMNLTNIDFGLIKKLTVGDFVWEDLNCNGQQETNEPGIKDIKVRLLDSLNNVIDTAVTNASGKFALKGIAIKYKLQFIAGMEYLPVLSLSTNPTTNSDIDSKGATQLIDFTDKSIDNNIDAGYVKYGTIGDQIWVDDDEDFVFDANEKAGKPIKVDLYNESSTLIKSVITDSLGRYQFTNIVPAKYRVEVVLPELANLTGITANRLFRLTSNNTYSTEVFQLKTGENKGNVDLGYIIAGSRLSGKIWNDEDASGSYAIGEELIGGFSVMLMKDDKIINSLITDANGEYSFQNLVKGTYSIKFDLDDELQITASKIGDSSADSDVYHKDNLIMAGPYMLGNKDTIGNIDAGVLRKSVLGDFVWDDINNNGLQEDEEKGINGVKLYLLNTSGVVMDSTTTMDNGSYLFQKVAQGSYSIKLVLPTGYTVVKKGVGSNNLNNDFDELGSTGNFILPLGADDFNIDAGLIKLISIGDFIWLDGNADGIQQANEAGLDSIKVDLVDESNIVVKSTATNKEGKYQFTDVKPGKYSIKINLSTVYMTSPINAGSEANDSDFKEDGTTELAEYLTSTSDLDGGLYKSSCIKGFTWIDRDENGIYNATIDSIYGKALVLLISADKRVLSVISSEIDGSYSFCNLPPTTYVLGYGVDVGYTPTIKGIDSPVNNINDNLFVTDSIVVPSGSDLKYNAGFIFTPILDICGLAWQDDNADGIRQETEMLLSDITISLLNERDSIIDIANTTPTGFYCFTDIQKGKYKVRFTVPPTMQATLLNVGDDKTDSDAIDRNDTLTSEVLSIDKASLKNVDIGLANRSIIGDAVWFDDNANGINDANELGAAGYIVRLYNENGEEIDLSATTVNGAYLFFNVKKGKYRLSFDKEVSDKFTLKDVDEDAGSDADTLGFTELFEVKPNIDYYNYDAGLIRQKLSISGTVHLDNNKNKQLDADDGTQSTRILLLNDKNEKIAETSSDANGKYLFDNLTEGKFYVLFDTISNLGLYKDGETNVMTLVTHESGYGTTKIIDVKLGSSIITDAFYFDTRSTIRGTLFFNKDGNQAYDVNTSKAIAEMKIFLQDENHFIIDSTYSDENGLYTFERLEPAIYFIEWTEPVKDTVLIGNAISDSINVPFCTIVNGINGGYTGLGSISGLAFVDIDENGLDNQAAKLDGVLFSLINSKGEIVARDTTRSNNSEFGVYRFRNIKAGKYRVEVIKPLFFIFSPANVGNNANDQEDNDFTLGRTLIAQSEELMVVSNVNIMNLDAGFIPRSPNNSSISGTAWTDKLTNGIREGNELFRSDIALTLCNQAGVELSKTKTNITGKYTFANLAEGFYFIKSELPIDETATFFQQGQDTLIDNDFSSLVTKNSTPIFYLGISESKNTIDLGIASMAMIGDFVWDDTNVNGIQDADEKGIPKVNVYAITAKGDTVGIARSDANGKYRIENIPVGDYIVFFQKPLGYSPTLQNKGLPTTDSEIDAQGKTKELSFGTGINVGIDAGFITNGGIGDRIWVDYNGNGVQESGEPGIDSVKVSLFTANNTFVRATFTKMKGIGESGSYEFEDVVPGDYYIVVDFPKGYRATQLNRGNTTTDSDINAQGRSALFTVQSGVKMDTVDAGILLPGCIGDRVWLDTNKNGIQDINEVGLSGIVVRLLSSGGGLLETMTTDIKGDYLFNTLAQGLFQIEVVVPSVYTLSPTNIGDDSSKDSDFAEGNGRTPLISLAHGAKIYDIDAGMSLRNQVKEEKDGNILNLYNPVPIPNPVLNSLQFDVPFDNCELSIYASTGNLVMRLIGYQKGQNIDVSGLQAGIYHAIVQSGNQRVSSKFIKVD